MASRPIDPPTAPDTVAPSRRYSAMPTLSATRPQKGQERCSRRRRATERAALERGAERVPPQGAVPKHDMDENFEESNEASGKRMEESCELGLRERPSPWGLGQTQSLDRKVSEDMPRGCVPSSPRWMSEVEQSAKDGQCTPTARDEETTAEESDPSATRHEGNTLTVEGRDGATIPLSQKAAVPAPRVKNPPYKLGNPGSSREANTTVTEMTQECLSPTSKQTLHAPESSEHARVEGSPAPKTAAASLEEEAVESEPTSRVARVATAPKNLFIQGNVEGHKVSFLVDTGAEITGISYATLAKLPRAIRAAFQDQAHTVTTVSGERVATKGPVLCNVAVAGRVVIDAVIAMQMEPEAILSLPTLRALGGQVTVAGVELLPTTSSSPIRQLQASRVFRVTVDRNDVIPPRSQMVVPCRIKGEPSGQTLVIEGTDQRKRNTFQVAHSVVKSGSKRTQVRLLNPTDKKMRVRRGQHIANATEGLVLSELVTSVSPGGVDNGDVPEHLKDLFEQTWRREKLERSTKDRLRELLGKHASLFASNDQDLGRTSVVEHDIDTGNSLPIRQPPRRPPIAMQPVIDKEIKWMLEAGVIERGQSPWSSPVVLVRKKDGSVRFCVDYRRLNAVTRFDAYPLPRIDETFESLSGARYFSTLDLISGYWQVGLTEQAKLKSAFATRSGLYLWNVMPFGLCNAPSTFERLMETVLQGLQWETCLIYMDDVVVFSTSTTEMLTRLDEVFSRLQDAGLKLKPQKCRLFARETEYLGHVVSEAGIAASPNKVKAIVEWPTPECATDVRSFLGTASYYRRFVRGFATIASPLHRLTEIRATWEWREEHQKAFDQLKAALAETPVLRFPVADAPYILDTDASLTGIGGVLSQVVDGQERVLGYASKALSRRESNYCVTRREMLAVVRFVRHFRPYLYGRQFTIRTDHASLQWLRNFKEPEGQLARWLEGLEEYHYDIVHRPGKQHGNADGLSRQQCLQCGRVHDDPRPKRVTNQIRLVTIEPRWSAEVFRQAQTEDVDLMPVYRAVENKIRPNPVETSTWPPSARRYLRDWDRLTIVDGVLARQWFDANGEPAQFQWAVPRQFVTEILQEAHAAPTAGHFSDKRTTTRAQETFVWPGMARDAREFCRNCEVCGARKPKPSTPHHLYLRQVTTEPLQRVAVDILGPLDTTERGNRYVLVMVDYFTKWLTAVPMPDQRAETCAEKFVREFVVHLGIPEQLHSDQGRQFEGELFQGMCRLLGIDKTRTTALHPQSDGQTERANSTLLNLLAKLTKGSPKDWDRKLDYACMAYNSSVHSVTGETPYRLMYGREMRTPMTLLAPPAPNQEREVEWVERLHQWIREGHTGVVERTQAQHRAEVPRLNKRQKGYSFEVGDLVWLYNPKPRPGLSPKLDADKWSKWEITRRISDIVYAVKKEGSPKKSVVNVDRLRPRSRLDPGRFPPPAEHAAEAETVEQALVPRIKLAEDQNEVGHGYLPDNNFTGEAPLLDKNDSGHESANDDEPWALPCNHLPSSPVTKRAQRARRKPDKLQDYLVGDGDGMWAYSTTV